MEKTLHLEAEIREHAGSKDAAKARKQGKIPAIVYGHKKETMSILIDEHAFVEGLHHRHRLIDVQIGKKRETMIIKELQYDHLHKDIIHVDLMRVDVTETVKVTVPIVLKGTAKGIHEGGVITEHANSLEVECMVTDIPEAVVVSVKDIDVGDTIHAKDVTLPEGVKLISSPTMLLVTCSLVAAAKTTEELEAEAPAAPEVITEVKKAEGEETEEEKE